MSQLFQEKLVKHFESIKYLKTIEYFKTAKHAKTVNLFYSK